MILCDISVAALLVGKRIEVDSPEICLFFQYHIFMLMVFGTMCAVMMGVLLAVFACCSSFTYLMLGVPFPYYMPMQSLERCATLLLICFGLALGLEGLAVLLCLVFMLMGGLSRRRGVQVDADGNNNFINNNAPRLDGEISIIASPDTPVSEEEDPCPICMVAGGSVWFKTRCGHNFHLICISDVRQNSCPMCRGIIFKEP